MPSAIVDKLERLGLDVKFLSWLEGKESRLPRIRAIGRLKDADLAASIRAATWLRQLAFQPEIVKREADDWDHRYAQLEAFLYTALKCSIFYSFMKTSDDLVVLEHVLSELLPERTVAGYRDDFAYLQGRGLPMKLNLPHSSRKRSGGKKGSEETDRMRAAIAYVETVSSTPYVDLAALWTECGRSGKLYHPDEIKSRLRKGHPLHRTPGSAKQLLADWRRIYSGDFRTVFPGRFPLGSDLPNRPE
jgi:hypothetical protein